MIHHGGSDRTPKIVHFDNIKIKGLFLRSLFFLRVIFLWVLVIAMKTHALWALALTAIYCSPKSPPLVFQNFSGNTENVFYFSKKRIAFRTRKLSLDLLLKKNPGGCKLMFCGVHTEQTLKI